MNLTRNLIIVLINLIYNFTSFSYCEYNYENYCYSLDKIESQYQHFSTKTAYGYDGPKELLINREQIHVPSKKINENH